MLNYELLIIEHKIMSIPLIIDYRKFENVINKVWLIRNSFCELFFEMIWIFRLYIKLDLWESYLLLLYYINDPRLIG